MRTFERTVDLLGPTLAAVLRVTRRVTLLVASLAVAVTACAPVAATGPLPGPGPTEGVADEDLATDEGDDPSTDEGDDPPTDEGDDPSTRCFPGMPDAACTPVRDGGDDLDARLGDARNDPDAQPKGGADDSSTRVPVVPAPDCEPAGPMLPC
jgi:hypothetical protein